MGLPSNFFVDGDTIVTDSASGVRRHLKLCQVVAGDPRIEMQDTSNARGFELTHRQLPEASHE